MRSVYSSLVPKFVADHEDLRQLIFPTKPLEQSVLLLDCPVNTEVCMYVELHIICIVHAFIVI